MGPIRPNWAHIFPCPSPAQNSLRFARVTMNVVVPHSCRIGAGYKSNGQPRTGSLSAMFRMRCYVADSISPTERTPVVRDAHRGAYDRQTIHKILHEDYVSHL